MGAGELVKKPGRPLGSKSAAQPGVRISVWLPQTEADRLIRQALAQDRSVSSLVKQLLKLKIER